MRFLSLLLSVGMIVFAQSKPAPPQVDKALRDRITAFYQAHADGRPRLAEPIVAPESKDLFFSLLKPRYLSFEILKIEYSDDYQRAIASVNCEEELFIMGAGKQKVKMPLNSWWELLSGEWYWYVDLKAVRQTPFGPVQYTSESQDSPSSPFTMPKGPSVQEVTSMFSAGNIISADKTEVRLSAVQPSSDSIVLKNAVPGTVKFSVERPGLEIPGFEFKLERADVPMGQTATLTFHYEPKGAAPSSPVVLNVVAQPTGKVIPIRITFVSSEKK